MRACVRPSVCARLPLTSNSRQRLQPSARFSSSAGSQSKSGSSTSNNESRCAVLTSHARAPRCNESSSRRSFLSFCCFSLCHHSPCPYVFFAFVFSFAVFLYSSHCHRLFCFFVLFALLCNFSFPTSSLWFTFPFLATWVFQSIFHYFSSPSPLSPFFLFFSTTFLYSSSVLHSLLLFSLTVIPILIIYLYSYCTFRVCSHQERPSIGFLRSGPKHDVSFLVWFGSFSHFIFQHLTTQMCAKIDQ